MKNRNKLTNEERELVIEFKNMKYPSIYKIDKTDRILFVELIDFDVCSYLLGKSSINCEKYSYICKEYERYLIQTDVSLFDEYTKVHYNFILKLMNLFKKYYSI